MKNRLIPFCFLVAVFTLSGVSYADTATTTENKAPELAWSLFSGTCELNCTLSFKENNSETWPIAQLLVVNNSENQIHNFEIISGNPHTASSTSKTAFKIDGLGNLYIKTPTLIDYEKYTSFNLVVRVTDNGSPVKYTDSTLKINLIDIPNDKGSGSYGAYIYSASSSVNLDDYYKSGTSTYFVYRSGLSTSTYGDYVGGYINNSSSSKYYRYGSSSVDFSQYNSLSGDYGTNYTNSPYITYEGVDENGIPYGDLPEGYKTTKNSKYPSYEDSLKETVAYGINGKGYKQNSDGTYVIYSGGEGILPSTEYIKSKYPGYVPVQSGTYTEYGETGTTHAVTVAKYGTKSDGYTLVSGFLFTETLSVGKTSTEVKALQEFLNQVGFPVASTGNGSRGKETTYFGRATEGAVKRFQASVGVSATGVVGPKTREKINAIISSK